MINQLTTNAEALRLFFTEDVYLVKGVAIEAAVVEVDEKIAEFPVVEIAETSTISIPVQAPIAKKEWNFEFLGKNQKGILILVNDHNNKVSSPQGTELLRKLVKAIELTNNDFALVNYANYAAASFEELNRFFGVKLVLSFGVAHSQLGLGEQPLHQLFASGDVKMIFTKNLHELDSDTSSKKVLWNTLQQLK